MKMWFKLWGLAMVSLLVFGCTQRGDAGYDPNADANAQLDAALEQAKQKGQNVLVQVGGSWCPWCVRLHKLFMQDAELRARLDEDYVWVQIYYGRDNENASVLSRLGDLKGYGYPVLVVVSSGGEVLHIQNTGDLEEGEGYNREKVLSFLQHYKDVLAADGLDAHGLEVDTAGGEAQLGSEKSQKDSAIGAEKE